MPLYEYVCSSCSHTFEELVMNGARPHCPSCQGEELERLFSTFAVGGQTAEPALKLPGVGACNRCGDPRGPGACSN